jgi:hypothetical protein
VFVKGAKLRARKELLAESARESSGTGSTIGRFRRTKRIPLTAVCFPGNSEKACA